MIGIDVVDLGNPRTRDRHRDQRFLDRIFSSAEQQTIQEASDPELTLWRFWAMKEAAFKAISSALHPEPPPVFAHPDFQGELEGESGGASGRVIWRDREVRLRLHGRGLMDGSGEDLGWCAATALLRGSEGGDTAGGSPAGLLAHRIAPTRVVTSEVGTSAKDADELRPLLSSREAASVHSLGSGLVRLAARSALAAAAEIDPGRVEVVAGDHPGGRIPPIVLLDGVPAPGLRVTLSHDGPWIAWGWSVLDR